MRIKKKNFENPLSMQFRIDEPSVFNQTPHIYVFLSTDYEYINENCRLVDFHGETIKIMVFCVYLNQYVKFRKLFQI